MKTMSLLAVIAVLSMRPAYAQPAAPADDHYFKPGGGALSTMDMSHEQTDQQNVTVVAPRPTRTWRSKIGHEALSDPRNNDAAMPKHTFVAQHPYCNSSLQTVYGQPSNAAEMVAGSGAGRC